MKNISPLLSRKVYFAVLRNEICLSEHQSFFTHFPINQEDWQKLYTEVFPLELSVQKFAYTVSKVLDAEVLVDIDDDIAINKNGKMLILRKADIVALREISEEFNKLPIIKKTAKTMQELFYDKMPETTFRAEKLFAGK